MSPWPNGHWIRRPISSSPAISSNPRASSSSALTSPRDPIAGKDALPVVQIGWDDAMAYAHWLGRDLPTEAEWEYAAQGGRGATRFIWGDAPLDDKHPQANVWQ